jgi:GntR family transcriptional repressor for pyruvate dehydrogenase complex
MDEALGDEQLSERADVDFHLQIALASHNQLFSEMMLSLTQRLQDSMQESRRAWFFAGKSSAKQLLDEHRGIVEAIRERNEALAAERMMRHIAKVDAVLQEYLK